MSRSILLLGATGVSGLAFIREAENQPNPPKLTLYVRSKAKLPEDVQSKHRVVVGGLDDEKALNEAMEGVDAVVSVLGAYMSLWATITRDTSTPIADSFPTIIRVMKAHGVKRILALATAAFRVPGEQPTWTHTFAGIFIHIVTPNGNAEMRRIGEVVSSDNELEWTVFRVPHLNDGPADLPVYAGLLGPEWKGTFELSRASQARWILGEIEERKWVRGAPTISNVKQG